MLPGKKFDVTEIVRILKARAWVLALPPVLALFAALIVAAMLPNMYQSDMLIAIIPQRVPDAFVRTTVTLRTEERLDALATQVMSRTVIEKMIEEMDLYQEQRGLLPMEDVVALMRNSIEVKPEAPRRGPRGPEPIHAFHVKFTYPDPKVAAQVTQKLGSLFVDQNARDRGALAEATNEFLETQLADARRRLEATEGKLEAFRERHGAELPTLVNSNLQVMQSTQMQIQAMVESIARDRDRKMMLERLYNEAQAETIAPPPVAQQPAGQPEAATAAGTPEQQLAQTRAALGRLEQRLRPEHPDVVRTRKLVKKLEEQVQAAAAAAPASTTPVPTATSPEEQQRRERLRGMHAEIESLDRQTQFKEAEERRLRDVVAEYRRRIEAVPGLESEWLLLTRDYETEQTAYKDLLGKSELSKVAVDLERRQIGEQFRILDPAGVPVRPISPNRIQINGIGLGIGIVLGLAIAVLLELRDTSFRDERDIVTVLSLPVLALVPYVETSAEQARRSRRMAILGTGGVMTVGAVAYVFWTMRLWNFIL